jgi:cytochrome c oxidase subunit 1
VNAPAAAAPSPAHPAPPSGFWRRAVFSTDHKVIARQYLGLGLLFLFLAGGMALLIRWQLANPFRPIPLVGGLLYGESGGAMTPEGYTMLFTMHGSLMVFFAITPILFGAFGNFAIPLQVGAADMAFPTLNMVSFWTIAAGGVLMIASLFVPGGAATTGWTAYAPLASNPRFTLGIGQTLWILGIALAGTSTLMGAINFVATTLNMRAPGLGLLRLPLAVWGFFFSSVLSILWVPVVAVGLFLILADRTFGTSFLMAGPEAAAAGGQPLLYQHLFWGFGHPEVYILILPVWGIVADILSVFSRKPAFGYRVTVGSMAAITVVSSVVWGHHMFTSGMNPLLGRAFMLLTITISVPTACFFFNWLATIWKGSLHLDSPMLYTLGIVFVFAIGGLTGLHNAVQALDIYIHDTYFVVGHFHYTLAASVFLGAFAGLAYWFPKMTGRRMNETANRVHFWLTFVLLNVVFFAMMRVGIAGHPRRIADPTGYSFLKPVLSWNAAMAHGAVALGVVQGIFAANLLHSFFRGAPAGANPWRAATLEWATSSPPPHHNFDIPPRVVRGPHEYSGPEADAAGTDWVPQAEPAPGGRP